MPLSLSAPGGALHVVIIGGGFSGAATVIQLLLLEPRAGAAAKERAV